MSALALRSTDGAVAEAHLDGAHVTSWRPAPDGVERLFLSTRSAFGGGAAIRGGVPVIFPQFAAEGPLPRHGFARSMRWSLTTIQQDDEGDARAVFSLDDSPTTRRVWPAAFLATLAVRVGGPRLAITLRVENRDRAPISYTAALHTYFRVSDLKSVELRGLQRTRYRESAHPGVLRVDDMPAIRPAGEVDRVYVDAPSPLLLRDGARALEIASTGFPDVVVWNPGAAKAAALADMEPGGERRMLCVEAAAVQRPVTLAPGEVWEATQLLCTRDDKGGAMPQR